MKFLTEYKAHNLRLSPLPFLLIRILIMCNFLHKIPIESKAEFTPNSVDEIFTWFYFSLDGFAPNGTRNGRYGNYFENQIQLWWMGKRYLWADNHIDQTASGGRLFMVSPSTFTTFY